MASSSWSSRGPRKGQRLTLRVTAMEKHEPQEWPARVRVRTMTEAAELKPGDAVRLKATLCPPPGPALPGDYDFARAAWFQGLGAVGYATAAPEPVASAVEPPLVAAGERRRSRGCARPSAGASSRRCPARPAPSPTRSSPASAAASRRRPTRRSATSGLFHILSISGLHMVIMAGAVFFSIRLVLAAIPAIALRYPIKKWAAAGAMAGAFGYLMISGAAFATVRSYIMISIMFLAVMLDRPALALRNVALAALAILLVWPESLFDPGFQMSFAAVVALVAAYEWLRRRGEERAAVTMRGSLRQAAAVFRRHRHLDADCQPRGGAVRHLPFPQHPAVRDPRQPHRHSHLQRDRHAGGAGDAGGDAVRAGGGAACR